MRGWSAPTPSKGLYFLLGHRSNLFFLGLFALFVFVSMHARRMLLFDPIAKSAGEDAVATALDGFAGGSHTILSRSAGARFGPHQ